jgi:hypothetical protein
VLGAPIGLCSEEHELISREGPFSGSIIHIHRWVRHGTAMQGTVYSKKVKSQSSKMCQPVMSYRSQNEVNCSCWKIAVSKQRLCARCSRNATGTVCRRYRYWIGQQNCKSTATKGIMDPELYLGTIGNFQLAKSTQP